MSRLAIALALPCALALVSGCAAKPPPSHVAREHVTKHYVVVVEEDDPLVPAEERAGARITRPVASGPLGAATAHETAFASRDPRYEVSVTWKGDCLDVAVARHGLAPFDDFDAHECVKPTGGTTTVATVTGAKGAPITLLVWLFDERG